MVMSENPTHSVTTSDISATSNTPKVDTSPMGDLARSYANMAGRTYYHSSITWTTSDAVGAILASYNAPFELLISEQQRAGFRYMTYAKFNTMVSIFPHTTVGHAGALGIAYIPNITKNNVNPSLAWLTNQIYSIYDAAAQRPTSITMPFQFPLSSVDISTYEGDDDTQCTIGTIVIFVLSPLQASDNTSVSCNTAVHVAFPEAEFFTPRGIPFDFSPAILKYLIPKNRSFRGTTKKRKEKKLVEKTHMMKFLKEAGSKIVTRAMDGLESRAQNIISGLDAEPVPVAQQGFTPAPFSSFNIVDQPHLVDPMSISSNCMMKSTPELVGTEFDDNLVSVLAKRPALFTTATMDTALGQGALVTRTFVSPNLRAINRTTSDYYPTFFEFYSDFARAWSGDIYIVVQVVAPRFVSGTLQFSFLANVFDTSVTLFEANQGFSQTLDFGDNMETRYVRIRIPYQATTPAKVNTLYPANLLSLEQMRSSFTGTFYTHVLNPLVVSDGVPTSVQLLYYVDCSEVRLYGFRGTTLRPLVEEELKHYAELPLAPASPAPPQNLNGMPSWDSIRDLAKRKSVPYSIALTANVPRYIYISDLIAYFSLLQRLIAPFAGWRGGLEFSILTPGQHVNVYFSNGENDFFNEANAYISMYNVPFFLQQSSRTLLIPFSGMGRYVLKGSLDDNQLIHSAGFLTILTTVDSAAFIYISGADDFRFVAPIGPDIFTDS